MTSNIDSVEATTSKPKKKRMNRNGHQALARVSISKSLSIAYDKVYIRQIDRVILAEKYRIVNYDTLRSKHSELRKRQLGDGDISRKVQRDLATVLDFIDWKVSKNKTRKNDDAIVNEEEQHERKKKKDDDPLNLLSDKNINDFYEYLALRRRGTLARIQMKQKQQLQSNQRKKDIFRQISNNLLPMVQQEQQGGVEGDTTSQVVPPKKPFRKEVFKNRPSNKKRKAYKDLKRKGQCDDDDDDTEVINVDIDEDESITNPLEIIEYIDPQKHDHESCWAYDKASGFVTLVKRQKKNGKTIIVNDNDNSPWPNFQLPYGVFQYLYEYQKVGVQWMASLYQQKNLIGGILADSMGMGEHVACDLQTSFTIYRTDSSRTLALTSNKYCNRQDSASDRINCWTYES